MISATPAAICASVSGRRKYRELIEGNDLDTVAGLDLSKGGPAARVCLTGRIRLDGKLGLSGALVAGRRFSTPQSCTTLLVVCCGMLVLVVCSGVLVLVIC